MQLTAAPNIELSQLELELIFSSRLAPALLCSFFFPNRTLFKWCLQEHISVLTLCT